MSGVSSVMWSSRPIIWRILPKGVRHESRGYELAGASSEVPSTDIDLEVPAGGNPGDGAGKRSWERAGTPRIIWQAGFVATCGGVRLLVTPRKLSVGLDTIRRAPCRLRASPITPPR